MTRPSDFRLQPAHARAARSSLLALPIVAGSQPPRDAQSGSRAASAAAPSMRTRTIRGISILAYCETSATSAALEAAGVDRRLAKTHLEVSSGGIDAALADCAGERTHDILVGETMLTRPQMLAQIDGLISRCDAATRIIVIGHINDIALYRELIRRGISEYLLSPVSPTQLIEAVANLCGVAAGSQPGSVIAFIGA